MVSAWCRSTDIENVIVFNTAIYLEYIVLQYVNKLHRYANFPFQLDLAPAHCAKTTINYGITVFN